MKTGKWGSLILILIIETRNTHEKTTIVKYVQSVAQVEVTCIGDRRPGIFLIFRKPLAIGRDSITPKPEIVKPCPGASKVSAPRNTISPSEVKSVSTILPQTLEFIQNLPEKLVPSYLELQQPLSKIMCFAIQLHLCFLQAVLDTNCSGDSLTIWSV